jgi:cation diffusion facilitator family transporter
MVRDRRSAVRQVLVITLVLNLVVVLIKGWIGLITGSLSLLADALHSITDSINNVLGLVTNQLADPSPDREHPYGHQKYEAIGALGIAAFLGIACFEIIQSAVQGIMRGSQPLSITPAALWLLLVVLGINIVVAFSERYLGQRLDSPLLIADAQHTMSDIWVTLGVLAGLIGIRAWGWTWLDGFVSFPVAIMVIWSAWQVLKSNLPWLIDEMAIAPEVIHDTVMTVPGVLNSHRIASRGVMGRQVFIDMHLIVDADDIETAHRITEEVEVALAQRYGPVRVMIHIEPRSYISAALSYGDPHPHPEL